MKVKHIITTCGIMIGGLAVANGASAIVTYKDSTDVQFTFAPVLSMSLSADGFVISNLTPGNSGISNAVTATVDTNNAVGYTLSATVGNSTYTSTDLVLSGGNGVIEMMGSGTELTAGKWGYTLDNGTTYGALSRTIPAILKDTNTSASSDTTSMKIGAYAATDQKPGTYNNVVNFTVVPKIATRTVTVTGSNTASVTPSGTDSYAEGAEVDITAVCANGYTFSNWGKSNDYGVIADPTSDDTTFTVGGGNTTLTAYCVSSS